MQTSTVLSLLTESRPHTICAKQASSATPIRAGQGAEGAHDGAGQGGTVVLSTQQCAHNCTCRQCVRAHSLCGTAASAAEGAHDGAGASAAQAPTPGQVFVIEREREKEREGMPLSMGLWPNQRGDAE